MTQGKCATEPPHSTVSDRRGGTLAALGELMALPPGEPSQDFEERRKQSIWERLDAIQQECHRGHRDLRKSVNELEAQADALDQTTKWLVTHQKELASAPVEATKLRFGPQMLGVIFTATITVAGSVVGAAAIVRSDMRNLNTRMDAEAKLGDQRYAEIKAALERQEQQRREDKAAAENRLKKYDNDELLRDLRQQGVRK